MVGPLPPRSNSSDTPTSSCLRGCPWIATVQLLGLLATVTGGESGARGSPAMCRGSIALQGGCWRALPGDRRVRGASLLSLRGGVAGPEPGDSGPRAEVVRFEERPGEGDAGGMLVLMHVAGSCSQEELDAMVERGHLPALVFDGAETAATFKGYQNARVQMEMRVVSPAPQFGTSSEGELAFFDAYDNVAVHTLMLQDAPRTLWFRHETEGRPGAFTGKVVLDVGAGTGILSMFAARAGARRVYAVEAASKVAALAEQLVRANGLDGTVDVIKSRVEDAALGVTVDVIVSEWMGFYLLHESMIHSVISARDKYLRPGGSMLPSAVCIFAAPSSMLAQWTSRVGFWANPTYGLNLSLAGPAAADEMKKAPIIATVDQEELLADPEVVWSADMLTVTHEEASSTRTRLKFYIPRDGIMRGVTLWFSASSEHGGTLSTGPSDQPTHWKQASVMLGKEIFLQSGTTIGVDIAIEPASPGEPWEERFKTISIGLFDPETFQDAGEAA